MSGDHDNLLTDALRGDSTALQRLLLVQFPALEAHIAAQIPREYRALVAAEDILQDAFAQAFRSAGQMTCENQRQFAAWLRTIADHRLADVLKGLRRRKRGGDVRQAPNRVAAQDSMLDLLEQLCLESGTPSRVAAQHEARQAVQVNIAALPDAERDAVRAKYLEGRDLQDIAAQLGRSPGAVRGLLRRAQQRLAVMFGSSSRWLNR